MTAAAGRWLLGLISASLLCALAQALMPAGPVRRVGELVCGLVLLTAMLSPLRSLDLSAGQRWLEDYLSGVELREGDLRQEADRQRNIIIEREYAAYIVDKAAQLGETCTARVETDSGGLPLRAEITGPLTQRGQEQLRQIIQEDLGIPGELQVYKEEELP